MRIIYYIGRNYKNCIYLNTGKLLHITSNVALSLHLTFLLHYFCIIFEKINLVSGLYVATHEISNLAGVLILELCIRSPSCHFSPVFRHFMPLYISINFTSYHFVFLTFSFVLYYLMQYNKLFSSCPVYLTKSNFDFAKS